MRIRPKKMLHMHLQGKLRRRRPNKRWLDNNRDDMKEYEMTKDMAQARSVWHMKTRAGPFLRGGGIHIAENVRKLMSTDIASTLVACKLVEMGIDIG